MIGNLQQEMLVNILQPPITTAPESFQAADHLESIPIFKQRPETSGMTPGSEIWREKSLPRRSEYEDSASDLYWYSHINQ